MFFGDLILLELQRGKPSTYGQILSERVHIIADDR